jgi:hypothetical protein
MIVAATASNNAKPIQSFFPFILWSVLLLFLINHS